MGRDPIAEKEEREAYLNAAEVLFLLRVLF